MSWSCSKVRELNFEFDCLAVVMFCLMWALRVQFDIESSIATTTELARGNGFVALLTAAPRRFRDALSS